MTRGLGAFYAAFVLSLLGTLFPHLFARDFLDDPAIVRWIAVPVLLVSSVVLADHHFELDLVDLIPSGTGPSEPQSSQE